MNETIPPLAGQAPQPKTSALAIWSLVLSILGFVLLLACIGRLEARRFQLTKRLLRHG